MPRATVADLQEEIGRQRQEAAAAVRELQAALEQERLARGRAMERVTRLEAVLDIVRSALDSALGDRGNEGGPRG
jgi:hypothetical protein